MFVVFNEIADADVVPRPIVDKLRSLLCLAMHTSPIAKMVQCLDAAAATTDLRANLWEQLLCVTDAQGIQAIVDELGPKIRQPSHPAQIVAAMSASPTPSLQEPTPMGQPRPATELDRVYSYALQCPQCCFCCF